MELKARVNKWQFIDCYINIWNGQLELTDKEKLLFRQILFKYLSLHEQGLKEPFLSQLLFSKESLNEIRNELGLKAQGFHNYKTQLITKRAIRETEGGYIIDPKLVPQKEVTFKFEVIK